MNTPKIKMLLKGLNNFLIFFFLIAFVITCCTLLFVSVLSTTLNIELTEENINVAAKLTFLNVLILSLIFSVIDWVRRKLTVERPTKLITQATEKIVKGDFSVRIKPQTVLGSDSSFNQIIDCFNKMTAELGSVETLRTDFISNVSHEMKTPLAIIQNYGTLLQAPDLSHEKRLEYALGVTDSSRRLAEMITNILKLNRLENQNIFPKATEYDLGEQLCQCLLQFEDVWEKKSINIETEIQDDVRITADSELLFLVWNNLLSNAFKFTEENGMVTVKLTADEKSAMVEVTDTGCGMTAEVGGRIFEKFYQGDSSHATEGNGLGLALVKRVIDILGGEISVKSTLGIGSSFTVTIRR